MDDEFGYRLESEGKAIQFLEDRTLIHFIALAQPMMHGVMETITLLEHRDYPVGTPKNDDFTVRMLMWMDVSWCLITIPREEMGLMEEASAEFSVYISNGTPIAFKDTSSELFPIQGENVYWLLPEENSIARSNDPNVKRALRESANETLEHIRNAYLANKPLH